MRKKIKHPLVLLSVAALVSFSFFITLISGYISSDVSEPSMPIDVSIPGSTIDPSFPGDGSGSSGGGGRGSGGGGGGGGPDVRSNECVDGFSIITTVEQLKAINDDLDGKYCLGADINLISEENWDPIGSSSNGFSGVFYGEGYEIFNFNVSVSSFGGLFDTISGGKVSNLSLSSFNVTGVGAGALAGGIYGSNISNIVVSFGSVNSSNDKTTAIGGLAGTVSRSNVSFISSSVSVGNSNSGSGGLIGWLENSTISNSLSFGNVDNDFGPAGGFVGVIDNSTISYSLSYASVSGNRNIGALVGSSEGNGKCTYSLYDNSVSGTSYRGPCSSGVGKTTTELQIVRDDDSANVYHDWDSNVWTFENGKYPSLNSLASLGYTVIGSGSSSDPFEISSDSDFNLFRKSVYFGSDKYFVLLDNINLNGVSLTPIGTKDNPFSGNVNGNGYNISNLKINLDDDYVGLFGYVTDSNISNLSLIEFTVTGNDYVGSLVGYANNSTIDLIFVNGSVNGTKKVGGVIGESFENELSRIKIASSVNGSSIVGGLVGEDDNSTISDVLSNSSVNGSNVLGGIAGRVDDSTISDVLSIGSVTSSDETVNLVRALLGDRQGISCSNSYWVNTTSYPSGDCGIGLPPEQLQVVETGESIYERWNHDFWTFADGSYPDLSGLLGNN